jgi:hypothetical protein
MALGNEKTLIKYDELPKFNGKRIESIYAVYENSRYDKIDGVHVYCADIIHYNCHVHDWDCGIDRFTGKDRGPAILKVKELPKEFQDFFGKVENRGRAKFITHLSFRLDGSGHASADNTLTLGGWEANSTTGNFYVYRGFDWVAKDTGSHVILNDSDLAQKIFNVLGKDFEVNTVQFWECEFKSEEGTLDFATKYPYKHTPIQIIDGLVYRDEKLSSWRWLQHGMPYRVPSDCIDEKGFVKNKDNICVWDYEKRCHVYFQKVDASELQEGDDNLVVLQFSYARHELYYSRGNAYCNIRRLRSGDYCKYLVKKIYKTQLNKPNTLPYEICELRNGKEIFKERCSGEGFYRIVRIVHSITHSEDVEYYV